MKNKSSNIIFPILYVAGFIGAGIIGTLSNSFFAYNAFNSLWSDILYLFFIALLFIAAYVQELLESRRLEDVIINSFVFIGCLTFLLLLFILSEVFTLLALIYSAVILYLVGFDAALKIRKGVPHKKAVDIKQMLAAASILLFAMARMLSIEFVNDLYIAWALIPTAIIFCLVSAAAFAILRKAWGTIYNTKFGRITNMIGGFFLIFIISFVYAFTALGIANSVFDNKTCAPRECIVLEKQINTGSRTFTQFKVKVEIDEREKWIPLPVTEYHEIDEGNTIIVNYHYGAFNFAYLTYGGKA